MNSLYRRSFICSGAAATVALPAASIFNGAPAYASELSNTQLVADQEPLRQ
jgi:hypothetical protein